MEPRHYRPLSGPPPALPSSAGSPVRSGSRGTVSRRCSGRVGQLVGHYEVRSWVGWHHHMKRRHCWRCGSYAARSGESGGKTRAVTVSQVARDLHAAAAGPGPGPGADRQEVTRVLRRKEEARMTTGTRPPRHFRRPGVHHPTRANRLANRSKGDSPTGITASFVRESRRGRPVRRPRRSAAVSSPRADFPRRANRGGLTMLGRFRRARSHLAWGVRVLDGDHP